MKIQELFKKDINREIQGVIKIGQKEKENIRQELEEYVVTDELANHFETFFNAYMRSYNKPTDKVGVWISGFFGSGKSHFLKILSYLLNSNVELDGKKAVSYFEDKIHNPTVLDNMKHVSESPSEVVLFNIDSKAESDTKQNKTAIVKVFNKVFDEMRGFSASIHWLAQLEETLEKNGTYADFQRHFEEETGFTWSEGRDELYYNMDETITALSKATNMSEESARSWIENGENNYSISVDSFAQRLKEYVDTKEDDFRLIFAADEVGQFISGSTQLMLNLQTVVEDLGKYCHGKVWVLVTSQQDIDSLREDLSSTDFSKIQGRFNTRVSLSSANADEVIKIRLLDKREAAFDSLTLTYDEHEAALKNKMEFENTATMRFYKDREDFARVYPFVPYQFNLLQKVFTGIREHGSAGKHLSDGERNLLESVQQATIQYQEENIGKLIPFYTFYENIDQALEHSVRSTIIKANQNESLESFDVNVLKLLFLIRYVDEMPGTIKNLTTLMISELEEDTLELGKRINKSLNLLEREFLIQRIGNKYLFLTNEEQDVNREISRIQIPTSELVNEAGKTLVDEILNLKRYTYKPFQDRPNIQYLMEVSQWIDDRALRNPSIDLGIRFVTIHSEYIEEPEVVALSQRETKVVIQLPQDENFKDLEYYLKINQYLRNQSAKTKTPIVQEINTRKANERGQIQQVFKSKLQSAVEEAAIYVNGYKVETTGSPMKRVEEGLRVLVESTYPKMNYMEKAYTKEMIEKLIEDREMGLLDDQYDDENSMATQEMERYLDIQKDRNMVITLRELMIRYQNEPYGWNDMDIYASLVRLIREEKVVFTLNSRKMDIQEPDFLKQIQKKDTQERIVVTKRKVLDSRIVDKVKRLIKDLFSITSIGEKEEDMYASITNRFSKEQKDLDLLKERYRYNAFPDQRLVEQGLKVISTILNIKDSSEFLTYLADHDQDILDTFDDLHDVKDFFNTNKKDIFINAKEKYKLYEEDRNYLNNEEIDYIMKQVNDILKMARPYGKIKQLNDLIDQFNNELSQHLENVAVPIQELIEQDQQDIERELTQLNGFMEHDKIQRNYQFKLDDLQQKVTNANTVGKLRSYKDESKEIKLIIMRQIEDAKQAIVKKQEIERQRREEAEKRAKENEQTGSDKSGTQPEPKISDPIPPVPEKVIKQEKALVMGKEEILPRRMVELRTEEDIEHYLKTVRQSLLEQLGEVDVIKLT